MSPPYDVDLRSRLPGCNQAQPLRVFRTGHLTGRIVVRTCFAILPPRHGELLANPQ